MQELKPFSAIRRLATGTEAREIGLQVFGAVSATTILIVLVAVTLKVGPRYAHFGADGFRNPEQGVWAGMSSDRATPNCSNGCQTAKERSRIARRRTLRVSQPPRQLKPFVPPPISVEIQEPYPIELYAAPEVESILAEAITPPLPEFALPPRPRGRVHRVLFVLSHPFRSFGKWFIRGFEPVVLAD